MEDKQIKELIKALALRQSALRSPALGLAIAYGDPLIRFFTVLEELLGMNLPETQIALGKTFQAILQKLTYVDIILLLSEKIKSEERVSPEVRKVLELLRKELNKTKEGL